MIYLITNALCIPFRDSNPLSPPVTTPGSLWGWALCRGPRGLWPAARRCFANARAQQSPLLFHLRACPPFMSSPFLWPWEFPIFLCLLDSLWEFLAHLFLPLFFSFPPFISFFTALHHRDSKVTQHLVHCWLCCSQQYFSILCLLSSTALLCIYIWGRAINGEKSWVTFWKGLMFPNLLDNTTFVC